MKRLLIVALLSVLVCGASFAGELRELPQYLVLNDPTTKWVEFLAVSHRYEATSPHAVITIHVLDSQGVRDLVEVEIRDTDPTLCTDVAIPYGCCTGDYPGDSNSDCTATATTYTDFVAGYGGTMKSRGDVLVWQRLQELYDTQATP